MKRFVFIVLSLIANQALSGGCLKLPHVTCRQSLLKGKISPNNRLQRIAKEYRGGGLFDSNDIEEEEEDMFDHLSTLNEFANLQQDIHSPPSNNRKLFKQNQKKIGIALMTTGIIFTLLGMMLFFEGNLLRLGNLSFLLGTSLLVGPFRISQFFMQPKRLRSTVSLSLGIFLVLIKWSKLGILCEIFGVFNLFGNMFPLLFRLLKSLPVVGDILSAFDGTSNSDHSFRKKNLYNANNYFDFASETTSSSSS